MKKNFRITFKITNNSHNAVLKKDGIEVFACGFDKGILQVELYYDLRPESLVLKAKADMGDSTEIVIMPHRIELWVNKTLMDEEWPAGNILFDRLDGMNGNIQMDMSEFIYEKPIFPKVTGSFENAQGWKPEENVFVGDCMPYVNNERYHILYLKDRHHHYSKWGLGAHQWAHISTSDFKKWDIHPMAVEITEEYEGSICTGSWIKQGDKEYLFYTVRMVDGSPAKICRSISKDGFHFEKDKDFSFVLSDKYDGKCARDPKVIVDENGLFHMILTTALKVEKKGCLAHLTSKDLDVWAEEENPIYISLDETEPECPDHFKYKEYYYLIYSLNGRANYLYSKEPFGEWKIPVDPIIPCSSVPKGAIWGDKIIFTGFKPENGYAGTLTFRTATSNNAGELIFK